MSAYLQDTYTALRTRITATWTDVVTGGVFEAEHIQLVPFADLTLPFAVIVLNRAVAADWGASNQTYIVQADVYYVATVTGPTGAVLTKLEALRDDLWTTDLTTGQVMPEGMALEWSDAMYPNTLFAAKEMLIRAGRLSVNVLVGETP